MKLKKNPLKKNGLIFKARDLVARLELPLIKKT